MYELILDPPAEITDEILQNLIEFNNPFCPDRTTEKDLAVVLRDDQGDLAGGVYGRISWGYLYVDCLWLREDYRQGGHGQSLLAAIEQAAIDNGYARSFLWTTSFQALGFYRKQGYEVFGELEDRPPGHTCYYLKKNLLVAEQDESLISR